MSKAIDERIERFKRMPERSLFIISFPVIISALVQVFYNITDTAFVGRLGVDAIAALTFSFPVMFVGMAIAGLVGSGTTTLIAQRLGARKKKEARVIATQAVILNIVFGIGTVIVALLLLKPIFQLMGASSTVIPLGFSYMLPIILSSPFLFLSAIMAAILTGEGEMKLPAIIRIISVFLNLSMDYVFIFILGWGVFGAGLATGLAFVSEVVMFAIMLRRGDHVKLTFKKWRYKSSITAEIIRIGFPMSIAHFLMAFSWLFYNRLFAYFGTETVASYGLVSRIDGLAFMPLFGLSVGLVTLVGMFYGAKEYSLITRVIKAAVRYGFSFSLLLLAFLWTFPYLFLRILTDDVVIIATGTTLLRMSVFSYPLMALGFLMGRSMLGLGDGKPALVTTIIRMIAVGVPLAWVLTRVFDYGPRSIILSMLIAAAISTIISFFWLRWKLYNISPIRATKV